MAVDDEPARVTALRANLARLGAVDVEVVERDVQAMGGDPAQSGRYDRRAARRAVQRRGYAGLAAGAALAAASPRLGRLAALQRRLLAAAAALVAPGGALTYSVCTLTRAETLEVVEGFLAAGSRDGAPGAGSPAAWALDDLGAAFPGYRHPRNGAFVQTLPSRDGTTGFFVARLRRVE